MRVQILAIVLLSSTTLVGVGATAIAPAPAPAAPVPARPAPPAAVPSAPATPPAPGQQLPPGSQQMESGPTFSGTNGAGMVPQASAQSNPATAFNGQQMSTNGMAAQFANSNAFGFGNNQFGAFTNQFGGSNQFAFHFTNQFGTNLVLQDEARTPQDRMLVSQIRKELLPVIRRDQLPIHLVSQNGMVILIGVALSAQESQQIATIVQQTPGVTSVQNRLKVNPNFAGHSELARDQDRDDEAFSDHDRDLLRDMRERMRHRQGENGASESVHIISRNGVITLSGFVASTAEEQALVAAAQNTPGVVKVDDDLQVRGQPGTGTGQAPGTGVGGASSPSGASAGTGSSSAVGPSVLPRNQLGRSLTNTGSPPR